jgi:hypothetical protein
MGITTLAMDITIVATGITTVATFVDNSYVAIGIDDIIRPVAPILLFKCARALNLNPVISLPHTHRYPLLLHVCLDATPTASVPAPRSSSVCALHRAPAVEVDATRTLTVEVHVACSLLLHVRLHRTPAIEVHADMNGGPDLPSDGVTIDLVEMSRKMIRLPINTIRTPQSQHHFSSSYQPCAARLTSPRGLFLACESKTQTRIRKNTIWIIADD